jgi:hypothetical protein
MINFVKTDIYGLTNCIQLQRSGLFLAERQEQVLATAWWPAQITGSTIFFD